MLGIRDCVPLTDVGESHIFMVIWVINVMDLFVFVFLNCVFPIPHFSDIQFSAESLCYSPC